MKNIFITIFVVLSVFFFASRAISIIITEKELPIVSKPDIEVNVKAKQAPDPVVELGKKLFFDPILSKDGTVSCASCHKPEHGFADDKPVSIGIKGQKGTRNSPTAFNTANLKFLFWDGRASSLEEQVLGPIENPIEMGEKVSNVLEKLNKNSGYVKEFADVFKKTPISTSQLVHAVAAFERTLISKDSDYDRFLAGDSMALSDSANHGLALFNGKAMCIACHKGSDFTDGSFHNIGLPITDDVGRAKISISGKDTRKFKTPTLRELVNTAPYFHTGEFDTLEAVIAYYNAGGGEDTYKDPLKKPLNLNQQEQKDLVAFLKSLTGRQLKVIAPVLQRSK